MFLKKFLSGVLDDIVRISTVPGVKWIFLKTSKVLERLLFSIGLITAVSILTYISWNILWIYRYKPLQTVISDLHYPIFKIPFPEITICNRNRLNWQRYNEAKRKFLLRQHQTAEYEQVFRETLNGYDTLIYGKFDNFENLSKYYEPNVLNELNYINFTHVVELMAWKCHEILIECSWVNRSLDCCEHFSSRKSEKGICLAFNTIETEEGLQKQKEDAYYPWRTMGSGPRSGLRVRIQIKEEWHSKMSQNQKGVLVMLVEPYVWAYLHYTIPSNTKAMLELDAFLHIYDDNTRIFSPDVRRCVFEDEIQSTYKTLPNHKYSYENCMLQCQQEYLMKFCNCTVDLFYPPGQYRACRLTDLPCLYHHNDIFRDYDKSSLVDDIPQNESDINCWCFLSCKSLRYLPDFRIENLQESNIVSNNTEVEVAVYFLWQEIMVYKTQAVYTVIDLMASFGGLASLCIGCSLVGLAELFYFLFFDVPKRGLDCCIPPKTVNRKILKTRTIFVREISMP